MKRVLAVVGVSILTAAAAGCAGVSQENPVPSASESAQTATPEPQATVEPDLPESPEAIVEGLIARSAPPSASCITPMEFLAELSDDVDVTIWFAIANESAIGCKSIGEFGLAMRLHPTGWRAETAEDVSAAFVLTTLRTVCASAFDLPRVLCEEASALGLLE